MVFFFRRRRRCNQNGVTEIGVAHRYGPQKKSVEKLFRLLRIAAAGSGVYYVDTITYRNNSIQHKNVKQREF